VKEYLISIDPGHKGAIALFDTRTGELLSVKSLSKKGKFLENIKIITGISSELDIPTSKVLCVLEDVGYHIRGNNAVNSCTFARHNGHLEVICHIYYDECVMIRPVSWIPAFLFRNTGKRIKSDKKLIAEIARNRTTGYTKKISIEASDAVALGLYFLDKEQDNGNS